jgi:hypothetical protein
MKSKNNNSMSVVSCQLSVVNGLLPRGEGVSSQDVLSPWHLRFGDIKPDQKQLTIDY